MNAPSPLFQLAVLLILLGCATFFICARTVLFGLNRYRLRYRARQGHRAAARLIALLDQPQRLSATLRIGTICSTMAASVAATLLALRHGAPGTLAPSPFILTLAVLMLAHPFGRLLAILPPPLFAYPASRPLALVSLALSPLTRLLMTIGQGLRRRIGKADPGTEPDDAPSLTELDRVVVKHGVTLVGHGNLPALVAADASALYARNLLDFLKLVIKDGAFHLDLEDDIVAACLMCHGGELRRKNA